MNRTLNSVPGNKIGAAIVKPSHLFNCCELMLSRKVVLTLLLVVSLPGWARNLADDFRNPPSSARPWVYWFFMDGNLSRDGITADLEAMRDAGIGGAILMEVDVGIPKGPVQFMSDPWRALFKHAVTEAERLGLEITLNAGPGWTGSGGPWVKTEQSMQHIVASETSVAGGRRFEGLLPQPQPRTPFFGPGPPEMEPLRTGFYRDIAVLAFPSPEGGHRIDDLDEKALYVRAPYSSQPGVKPYLPAPAVYPQLPALATIAQDRIVDLTERLGPDGWLTWDVPAGHWTILRFGRVTTGANTRPAPQPGLGFECDKFDSAALDSHFEAFVGALLRELGPRPNSRTTGWTMLHIDSWEMGAQNWTAKFRDEFQHRRGYDPLPYLPAMTGRVVESLEISERFLWDLRQTAQELVVENYAQRLKTLGRRHGFGLSIEPYDMNPCSDLSLGAVADIPMCEFWAQGYGFNTVFSCIEAVSIAHTIGRPIVAAEAFTSDDKEAWRLYPGAMKPQADWAFCMGINRLVFHRYAHQPWLDRSPGMTMGPYGVHYERTQTWWAMVKAWHEYLARCQAMLHRGLPVADICYLAPEGAPHVFRPPASALQGPASVPDRRGYNFDGCAPELLLAGAKVKNGQLVLPGGMSYRVLVLPMMETMTPSLLHKIRDLVKAGATVIGPRPLKSPSLSDYPRCDLQVQRLGAELWEPNSPDWVRTAARRIGKGRVVNVKPHMSSAPVGSERLSLPSEARWIWYPEGVPSAGAPVGTRLFHRVFDLQAGIQVESAQLLMTADNAFELRVNDNPAGKGDNFTHIYAFDLEPLLKPGINRLSVSAKNGGEAPNPAGLIGALLIRFRDGHELRILTDHQWECTDPNTSTWQAAMELGELGMSPWGMIDKTTGPQEYPEPYGHYDSVAEVLGRMGVPPDFESDVHLRYTHRRDGKTDVYFVANPAEHQVAAQCSFRVASKQPEIWDPMTGAVHTVGQFTENGGRTLIPLSLEAGGSAFVVFAKPARGSNTNTPVKSRRGTEDISVKTEIRGPWEVRFQRGRGAPEKIVMEQLTDWSEYPDPGVKYFSGQATYQTTFLLDSKFEAKDAKLMLGLGQVYVMAQVKLNGQDMGILWRTPFQVDITHAVKLGENTLEITVANLWPNRLIGDQTLPPQERVAWTTWNPFTKGTPLLPSGLLGPVCCETVTDAR